MCIKEREMGRKGGGAERTISSSSSRGIMMKVGCGSHIRKEVREEGRSSSSSSSRTRAIAMRTKTGSPIRKEQGRREE